MSSAVIMNSLCSFLISFLEGKRGIKIFICLKFSYVLIFSYVLNFHMS